MRVDETLDFSRAQCENVNVAKDVEGVRENLSIAKYPSVYSRLNKNSWVWEQVNYRQFRLIESIGCLNDQQRQ